MNTPDGMGADRYRERQNMKKNHAKPNYDLVAVSHEGDDLYVTESAFTQEEAEQEREELNAMIPLDGRPDVKQFEIRER